jgi:hypothetical protein
MPKGQLVLADGSTIRGKHFGAPVSNAVEAVDGHSTRNGNPIFSKDISSLAIKELQAY